MSKDTIKVNMNVYDIPIVVELLKKLEQENNQLKSILTELEEWLKEEGNNGIDEWGNHYSVCLYKLNMLKEKYK